MEEKIVGILLEMQKDVADLKQEVKTIKPELRAEMKEMELGLRQELTEKIETSEKNLKSEIQELKNQRYIDSHNIAKILEYQIEMNKHYC